MVAQTNPTSEIAVPERSTRELVGDLTEQVPKLIRTEIRLAQRELRQKGKQVGVGAAALVVAAVVAFLGAAAFVAAAIIAVALVLPGWAAALIIGGGLMLVALVAAIIGYSGVRRGVPPFPKAAVSDARSDYGSVREAMHH